MFTHLKAYLSTHRRQAMKWEYCVINLLRYQPILPDFSATRLSTALFSTGLFNVLSSPPSLYSLSHVSLIFSTVCYCIFLLIEPGARIDHLCGRTGLEALLQKYLQHQCSHSLTRIYINSSPHSTDLNLRYMPVLAHVSNSIECFHSPGKHIR